MFHVFESLTMPFRSSKFHLNMRKHVEIVSASLAKSSVISLAGCRVLSRTSISNLASKPRARKNRCYGSDYFRTNMMADYLDKLSTDINYITYMEEEDCDSSMAYLNMIIVIVLLLYMFLQRPPKS